MEKRKLGRSDLEVSVLTFGCWQAGGGSSWTDTSDDDSLAAMRAALESGINFFDTAEGYNGGHSETVLGQFLKEANGEALVATKVGAHNLAPEKLKTACEKSLERLGVEAIDLYQIHWPAGTWGSPLVPIADSMGALEELKSAGKIRAIGVSNFSQSQIAEALNFGRVDSLQPPYSLFFAPYAQDGTVEFCAQNEIAVIPYSPMAQGLVTGKFNKDNRPTDNRAGNVLFKDPTFELALEAVEKLRPLASEKGCTTAHLALAWLLAQNGVTSPIVGARTPQQISETARAAEVKLSGEEIARISQIAQPVLDSLPDEKTNMWA